MTPEERVDGLMAQVRDSITDDDFEEALRHSLLLAISRAVAEESEACAKVAEGSDTPEDERGHISQTQIYIAAAIRARSKS